MKFIFSIIAIGLIGSCKTAKYSHFTLRNSTWGNTGELETNGYYYCNLNDIEGRIYAPQNSPHYQVFVLFSNGTFWTETWANHLSKNYFGNGYYANPIRFPVQDISWFNLVRLRLASPLFWP